MDWEKDMIQVRY